MAFLVAREGGKIGTQVTASKNSHNQSSRKTKCEHNESLSVSSEVGILDISGCNQGKH